MGGKLTGVVGRQSGYRGRLAPTPSGMLHAGHARTFREARVRAHSEKGTLVLRMEDIDRERCRPEYEEAVLEDLAWMGIRWDEGGFRGGEYGPYRQSDRLKEHERVFRSLIKSGFVYPSDASRKEILAENPGREIAGGVFFPGNFRKSAAGYTPRTDVNWRFRVPDGRRVVFKDGERGTVSYVAGEDFGDFLIWRKSGSPSYELAVVADDIAMKITEVVRGEDLLLSTARQILIYEAVGARVPRFCHVPLVCEESGARLSKTAKSVSIRELREKGWTPEEVFEWADHRAKLVEVPGES